MCLLGDSRWWIITFRVPKSPKTPHFGAWIGISSQMRKIQITISSDMCIRLTWNLTGSCGQQQRLRGWSRMVWNNSKIADGRHFKNLYSPYLSVKSSDIHEILYTAADFELDERHVIKNEKVALDRLRVRQNVFLDCWCNFAIDAPECCTERNLIVCVCVCSLCLLHQVAPHTCIYHIHLPLRQCFQRFRP